jgi:hypothetical protein
MTAEDGGALFFEARGPLQGSRLLHRAKTTNAIRSLRLGVSTGFFPLFPRHGFSYLDQLPLHHSTDSHRRSSLRDPETSTHKPIQIWARNLIKWVTKPTLEVRIT